jgi:hypothetical protein
MNGMSHSMHTLDDSWWRTVYVWSFNAQDMDSTYLPKALAFCILGSVITACANWMVVEILKIQNFDYNVDLIMFQKSNILNNGSMWLQNCSQK